MQAERMAFGVIFLTTCHVNDKVYVGQSVRTGKELQKYMGSGLKLKRAKKKYGDENFSKFIIQECFSREELNRQETFWISYYDSTNPKIRVQHLQGWGDWRLS